MDLTSIATTIDWSLNDKDDHSGGGIFITLPNDLAKKFPKSGKEGRDSSPPHITVVYIDDVAKKQDKKGKYIQAIEEVCTKLKPFSIKLGETKSLVNASGEEVFYASVDSSDLKKLNSKIKSAFDSKNLSYSKKYKSFKPHVTIEYVAEGDDAKYSDKEIKGSFTVDYVWLWGFGQPSMIFLGGK